MNQQEIINEFIGCNLQSFDDVEQNGKKRKKPELAKVFSFDPDLINKLQALGAGIFIGTNPTINDGCDSCKKFGGVRDIEHLQHIDKVSMDLDVAKEKNGISIDEIKVAKGELYLKLINLSEPPQLIFETKNGLQPVWVFDVFKGYSSNKEANDFYRAVVKGLGDHIGYQSEGDNVIRVIRLPGTKHLKTFTQPFEIKIIHAQLDKPKYDFAQFLEKYKPKKMEQNVEVKSEVKKELAKEFSKSPKYKIDLLQLPLEEVIIKSAATNGISIAFKTNSDGSKQIIENGEETSGFISSNGEYCYSSSGKERKGNQITVAAYYLNTQTKEAISWLIKTFKTQVKNPTEKSGKELKPKSLLEIVIQKNATRYIPISGVIDGKFYQTVFAFDNKYRPYVIFEDFTETAAVLEKDEEVKYHCINYKGIKYIFDTQEPLWFQGNMVNSVDNRGINDFLQKKIPEKETLFCDLETIIQEYYDFYNPLELKIVAIHIIHSYLIGLLGKAIYLILDGEADTGKSVLQETMALLQFNGCFSGNSTMPSLVRKIHSLRATVNLDELDKYDAKDKPIIIGILNTGAYKSGTKEIVNMDGKVGSDQLRIFRTFSAKTFSVNKIKLDPSFLSRCVIINTVRNKKIVKDIRSISDEESLRFQNLRNALFAYTLRNGRLIFDEIKQLQTTVGLYGRRADICSIILGIAQHFTADISELREFLKEKEDMEKEDRTENDRLFHTMIFLLEKSQFDDDNIIFTNKALLEYVNMKLDKLPHDQYAATSSSIGLLLKRSKIIQKASERKREGGKGNYIYSVPKKRIIEIAERMGNLEFKSYLENTEFTSSQNNKDVASDNSVNDPDYPSQAEPSGIQMPF